MAGDYRQCPLNAAGRARNRAIGVIRAPVERTFAILQRWYGYGGVRYRSLVRKPSNSNCWPWPWTCAAPWC